MPTQDVLCRGMTVSLVLQVGGDRAGMRSEHEAICRSGVDHMSRSPTREIHLSRHHLLECTHDGLADIVAARAREAGRSPWRSDGKGASPHDECDIEMWPRAVLMSVFCRTLGRERRGRGLEYGSADGDVEATVGRQGVAGDRQHGAATRLSNRKAKDNKSGNRAHGAEPEAPHGGRTLAE